MTAEEKFIKGVKENIQTSGDEDEFRKLPFPNSCYVIPTPYVELKPHLRTYPNCLVRFYTAMAEDCKTTRLRGFVQEIGIVGMFLNVLVTGEGGGGYFEVKRTGMTVGNPRKLP